MTAFSPVEDKAREEERSAISPALAQASTCRAPCPFLAKPHLEKGLGEDVGSFGSSASEVGEGLVGALGRNRVGKSSVRVLRTHRLENAGTELEMGHASGLVLIQTGSFSIQGTVSLD